MSKTLSAILTVFKVARIVAKVIFILCIIGGVGSLLGLISLPLAVGLAAELTLVEEGQVATAAYPACAVGLITCAGEAVFAFLAERYCKGVLAAGTPYTFDGARECFRLGIASLIVSASIPLAVGIFSGVILLLMGMAFPDLNVSISVSVSAGLFLMFLSLLFKHGAELQQASASEDAQEAREEIRF